jgi:hypothetical protein
MIVLEQGLNGYDADGLNGGLKIAAALKKVTLKGAIKGIKTYAPMALSLIPVVGGAVGGVAGKVLTKISTNKDGTASLVGRTIENVKEIAKTDIGKSAIKLASPLVKNAKAALLEQNGALPNDAQLETLAAAKGTTAQQELDAIVAAAPTTAAPTTAKDNTMLYVGGGIVVAGIAYVAFK